MRAGVYAASGSAARGWHPGWTEVLGSVDSGTELSPNIAPPPGNPRFPLVDSVRGIAVLSIILLHLRGRVGGDARWVAYWNQLSWGVGIFFVISGFLLYRPFVAAGSGQAPRIRIRDFYRRRILRIVPGYWLALTFVGLAFGLGIFGRDLWRYYLLVQSYDQRTITGGLHVTWSLSIEAGLYLVLPIFVLAVTACRRWIRCRSWVLDLAMVSVTTMILSGVLLASDPSSVVQLVLANTVIFLFGMCLAAFSVGATSSSRVETVLAAVALHDTACWVAGIGLILCGTAGVIPSPFNRIAFLMEALAAVFIVVPAISSVTKTSRVQRLLSNRILAWVGLVSYGLYLWHEVLVFELRGGGTLQTLPVAAIDTVVGVGLTFVAATVSFYAVEQPIMRRGRRGHRTDRSADPHVGEGTSETQDHLDWTADNSRAASDAATVQQAGSPQ